MLASIQFIFLYITLLFRCPLISLRQPGPAITRRKNSITRPLKERGDATDEKEKKKEKKNENVFACAYKRNHNRKIEGVRCGTYRMRISGISRIIDESAFRI